jgi:hypothetical protein
MKYLCLYFILSQTTLLSAQPKFDAKRDYVWIFGKEYFNLDTVDHIYLDFRTDTMSLKYRRAQGQNLFQTNASICDTAGNLLFFSNGCVIVDSGFQYLPGADTINKGLWWSYSCDRQNSDITFGYLIVNGCWALPVAGNKFKVLYADLINATAHSSGIRFSTIIQNKISNKLEGFNPDTYLLQEDIQVEKRGIVRHANGRDWWMINEAYQDKKYYITLIDSSGQIYQPKQLTFNELPTRMFHGGGQACFSPDGAKYCTIDAINQCQVFDFDRCTGEMSNPIHIPLPLPYDSIGASTGIAISPNSRFMYLMTLLNVWQYDLDAADIEASKIRVAQNDGWKDQWGNRLVFYQSQIGPDGKIYIFPPAGRSAFSVIEQPDSLGMTCNVNQHKYFFPQWGNVSQPPRFPNFRLGPEIGSPCDTIISSVTAKEQIQGSFILRPNPAIDYSVADITVSGYSSDMLLSMHVSTLDGHLIQQYEIPPYVALKRIETSHLPNGIYFVTLKSKGMPLKTEKLVVLRE